MSFAQVWAKSQEGSFRQRLTVAVMEQCRWTLQRAPLDGESSELYAWRQDLARVLRSQVQIPATLTSVAIYALLPWESFDPEDDEALQTRIALVFDELAGSAAPA
jgi:hypothetical protein